METCKPRLDPPCGADACPAPAQELAQLDYECLRYQPSKLAAAAMLVAHAHVGDRRRMSALTTTSGYSTSALKVGVAMFTATGSSDHVSSAGTRC